MTFLNTDVRALVPVRHNPFKAQAWLRVGLEGFLLTALFLFLAGSALYLRARLGFAL